MLSLCRFFVHNERTVPKAAAEEGLLTMIGSRETPPSLSLSLSL